VGAGFKHFRPLIIDSKTGELAALDNDALAKQREFAPYSREQYAHSREDFYESIEALIDPKPLPPVERLRNLLDALEEQARRRVLSVDNGEGYARKHPGQIIAMTEGYEIFETSGAWEDFATPSRDMRLLIAIDTVKALPRRVQARPQRFVLPPNTSPSAAAQELRKQLDSELKARVFQYTRSNGSIQKLTLADVIARAGALEMAYNPNDCVEIRWGASQGSAERATCTRVAPADQQTLMQTYRSWFHTRTRPSR
jgi:hypothetical protein